MATYIQGLTDYIPQIQPFQPDLNFYGNIMQTRQNRYDAAKKKVSDLYGSLLYAPLTGDNNIKRRDDFFKFIDNDIKRISGMDLSLQQNQDAALDIFKGFYDDKDMVNDMVWTRAHNTAIQKHEALKGCTDPAKCGGQAWEDGYLELMYKREDFKKASDQERLNFEAPSYTPYYNWQAVAEKAARDKGYKVTRDTIKGDYKVTKQNGELLAGGLRSVFREVYGSDPRVEANYKTKAFVTRKTTVKNDADLYGSEEASNIAYLNKTINKGLESLYGDLDKYKGDYNSTDKRIQQLQASIDAKGGTAEELKTLEEAYAERDKLQSTKDYLEKSINSIKANAESGDIRVLESRADASKAQLLLKNDLDAVAKSISEIHDVILEQIGEAPYVAIKKNLEADLVRKKWDRKYKLEELAQKNEYDIGLKLMERETEEIKLGIKSSAKKGSAPIEDITYREAVGGSASELDVKKQPALAYGMNMDEWTNLNNKAQSSAANFNYEAFNSAKEAKDIDYLNEMYGKGNWEKVRDVESFQQLVQDKKLTNVSVFDKTLNYLKVKTSNVAWGEELMYDKTKEITNIKLARQAADETFKYNINSLNKAADEAKKQVAIDPRYRYVDYMFHSNKGSRGAFFMNGGKAPANFIKTYMSENLGSSPDDAQNVYKFLHDDVFGRYNSASNKDASVNTGFTLGGTGIIQGRQMDKTGVDPSDREPNSVNMYTRDLLSKIKNDQGNSFAGTGINTKENYLDAVSNKSKNEVLKVIAADFIHTIDASGDITNKDEKKAFYDVSAGMIGGENKDMAYLQITLPQSYIEKRAGKDKMISPELAKELYYNPINIFYDKSKIKSKFVERATDTDIQRTLATKGYAPIDSYENISSVGPIMIKYDKERDIVTYKGTLKVRDKFGNIKTAEYTRQPTSLAESEFQKEQIIKDLEATKQYNLAAMRDERTLNKNKNK